MREVLGDAKVAQLDLLVLGQKDILRLDVPVQDLAIVDVLETQTNLHQPVYDLLLAEETPVLLLDTLRQVEACIQW